MIFAFITYFVMWSVIRVSNGSIATCVRVGTTVSSGGEVPYNPVFVLFVFCFFANINIRSANLDQSFMLLRYRNSIKLDLSCKIKVTKVPTSVTNSSSGVYSLNDYFTASLFMLSFRCVNKVFCELRAKCIVFDYQHPFLCIIHSSQLSSWD